jgi:hypothetical protein
MSILLDGVCVVVPIVILEEKYSEGWRGFAADFSNGSFRRDEKVAAVSYFDRQDAACVVTQLTDVGLQFGERCAEDICVFDAGGKFWLPCLWLDVAENPDGLVIADYVGQEPDSIAVPSYFDPDDLGSSLGVLYRLTHRQLKRRLEAQRADGDGLVFRDRKNGNIVRAGLPILRH